MYGRGEGPRYAARVVPLLDAIPACSDPGAVVVLVFQLDRLAEREALLDAAASCLSAAEQARAERYARPRDRDRFRLRRALLRNVIARELGQPPGSLAFGELADGKPVLATASAPPLHFSTSDSADAAAIAIARAAPVGIDLEPADRSADFDGIARRFFRPREQAHLAALAPAERSAAFLRMWALKEAVAKADGRGMGRLFARLDVLPERAPADWPLGVGGAAEVATCGAFARLVDAGPGLVAALAARAPRLRVVVASVP